jgi:hypothetical protein
MESFNGKNGYFLVHQYETRVKVKMKNVYISSFHPCKKSSNVIIKRITRSKYNVIKVKFVRND